MKLFSQILFICRLEAQFFSRYPKMLVASVVVACIPALYAQIYLFSVWDPAANASALPVGLVNLDEGVAYRDSVFNMGNEVAAELRAKKIFGFQDLTDPEIAKQMVRTGQLAFTIIIPKDFSSHAVPGREAGGGKLVVFTSEGNNFESARIASVFAQELGHDVNESLNERRWRLVLSTAAGSQQNVERLRAGVLQLQSGAHELANGANQTATGARTAVNASERIRDGVVQLTSGFKQVATGIRTMEAKRPHNNDLRQLKSGSEELAAAHVEMDKGLATLQAGSTRLLSGVNEFRNDARNSLLVPGRVADGLDQVSDGVDKLDAGLRTASSSHKQITEGAQRLNEGVDALTTGLIAMNRGIHGMASKLPADSHLDELDSGVNALSSGLSTLSDGNQRLKLGMDHLTTGVDLLFASLPAAIDQPEGNAKGLANSVKPELQVDAPVPNSGSAFAPNVIPAALWLGASIAAFLVHVRVLPRHAQVFSPPAQLLGKMIIPALVVLAQALLIWITVIFLLKIHVRHEVAFILTLALASLTFLAIVFALTRMFGDAGKGLAMIFLAVQLSSSGGIMPIELSGGLFANISPWMPLTWVVHAMKAAMFGAYNQGWEYPLTYVVFILVMALASACWLGHWRYVKPASVRPAIDF